MSAWAATGSRRRGTRAHPTLAVLLGGAALVAAGCGAGDASLDPAAAAGRHVYQSVCIACHNADPTRPGSLGPAIAGSPRELVEAKVLRGEYPPGYTPKRTSHAMPPLGHLAGQIDEITAYLNATAPRGSASSGTPPS